MEVIFIQDVPGVAKKGDQKKVADGFARNYLFPKKLALEISAGNAGEIADRKRVIARRLEAEKKKIIELAKQMEAASLTIEAAVGEEGKMFGSVTAADVEAAIKQKMPGVELVKHAVLLKEPIKQTGAYTIEIRLHPEVTAALKLWVIEKK